MASFTHKVFLFWLLYFVTVLFGWGALLYLKLPQIALFYDHSYLTYLLFGLYGVAESMSGYQVWKISKENKIADDVTDWLCDNKLTNAVIQEDNSVTLEAETSTYDVPKSVMAEHFMLLCMKANAGQKKIRQNTLIDVTADRIYDKTMIAEFIASRIVWVGILATILGVIMAFWPMIDGVSIDTMKTNLGSFFGGIAVAFIPTAVSFVFKIVLDFNTKIVGSGVRDLIDKIAVVSETELLPIMDNEV